MPQNYTVTKYMYPYSTTDSRQNTHCHNSNLYNSENCNSTAMNIVMAVSSSDSSKTSGSCGSGAVSV